MARRTNYSVMTPNIFSEVKNEYYREEEVCVVVVVGLKIDLTFGPKVHLDTSFPMQAAILVTPPVISRRFYLVDFQCTAFNYKLISCNFKILLLTHTVIFGFAA